MPRFSLDRLLRVVFFSLMVVVGASPAAAQSCATSPGITEQIGSYHVGSGEHAVFAPSPESISAFEVAAKLQPKQMADLLMTRGAPPRYTESWNLDRLVSSIREMAKPGDDIRLSILFFSYADGVLRSWLVSRCGIEAYAAQAIERERVDRSVAGLRSALNIRTRQAERAARRRSAVPDGDETTPSSIANPLAELTSMLFPSSFRLSLRRFSYVVIVPALGIGTVPFSMLKPFGDDDYLIDHLAFSIAASLGDAQEFLTKWSMKVRTTPDGTRVKIAGNTTLTDSVVIGNPSFAPDPDYDLPKLPGAEKEAHAVADIVKGKLFVGPAATKEAIAAAARETMFLYLATHGVANDADPLKGSFLALAGTNGRWTAYEIQNTPMRNALVVLSACQTGLGKTHDAGIIGLARAFQISGADVVMSLWSIDDEATVDLMTAFVENLSIEGHADALRHAMLSARKAHPDPARWASFSIFGNPW